jgi:hypothetical protein
MQKWFAHVQQMAVDGDCNFHIALSVAANSDVESTRAVCDVHTVAVHRKHLHIVKISLCDTGLNRTAKLGVVARRQSETRHSDALCVEVFERSLRGKQRNQTPWSDWDARQTNDECATNSNGRKLRLSTLALLKTKT